MEVDKAKFLMVMAKKAMGETPADGESYEFDMANKYFEQLYNYLPQKFDPQISILDRIDDVVSEGECNKVKEDSVITGIQRILKDVVQRTMDLYKDNNSLDLGGKGYSR